jgi:putative phage-type endonuclease
MSTILRLAQGTPEWLEHRRKYRNASETPAVVGVSPWVTPYALWLERTGRAQRPVTPAMRRGRELEAAARGAYERLTGLVMEPLVLVDGEYSASLDGITLEGDLIVEIKCPMQGRGSPLWQAVQEKQLPEFVFYQVQHQLMVTGARIGHLYVFDGSEGLLVEVKPEERGWNRIRSDWDVFMSFIAEDQPPPLCDHDTRKREDEAWRQAAEAYIRAKQDADVAAEALNVARDRIVSLARHPSETGFGVTALRYWRRGGIDYKTISALHGVDLERYRGAGREEVRLYVKS